MSICVVIVALLIQPPAARVQVLVTSNGQAVAGAQVVVAGQTQRTGSDGRVILSVPSGLVEITVVKEGFNPETVRVAASGDREQTVDVALKPQATLEEHVTVSATRTDARAQHIR